MAEKGNVKGDKLFQNILRTTEQFVQGKGFYPMSEAELFQRLSFPSQHLPLFREILSTLTEKGLIETEKGLYRTKSAQKNIVKGILRVHPRGFGFLQLEDQELYEEDIFIPKPLTLNAIDGDFVEVQVNPIISEKGPEGKVIAILSRGRTHLAGIIREINTHKEMIAYVPLLGSSQRVVVQSSKKFPLKLGDRLVMEVVEWGDKETETLCNPTLLLGHISDPSCDIPAAIAEYELRSAFPKKVVEEAKGWGTQVSLKEVARREDLRNINCFTIDPDTAKDFDDAINVSKDSKGNYHLGVHIADVSHYVHPDSAMDQEALLRCNSTYFPNTCLPMLPSALSDNLCSLKPNVNRLAVSVLVDFDAQGNMTDYRITRSVIKSEKRFSYREAKEILDGKKRSKHAPTLHLMVELCKLLKKKRFERGSIEFSLPELVVKVDKEGIPYGTDYVEYDVTHQLVEEFMLKANEIVATHLNSKGKNLTYRVHDIPAEENMRDFSALAGAFGFKLSSNPTPAEIQTLFDEALNTPYGPYLATSYIRRMRLAVYSPDNIGHYGLSLSHYCHFTSPIRRYVDLVAHRILFGESDDREELERISQVASERERISAKAESSVLLLKKLRLLKAIHEKEGYKQHEAVISRIKNFGLFFEVIDFMLEGFLHISEIGNDFYIFEEGNMRLRGRHQGGTFTAGDKISVILKSVDLVMMECEWQMAGNENERRRRPPMSQIKGLSEKREISSKKSKRSPHAKKKEKVSEAEKTEKKVAHRKKTKSNEKGDLFSLAVPDTLDPASYKTSREEQLIESLKGKDKLLTSPRRRPFPALRSASPQKPTKGKTDGKPIKKSGSRKSQGT